MGEGREKNDCCKLYLFNKCVNLSQHYSEQVQLSKCHKYIFNGLSFHNT